MQLRLLARATEKFRLQHPQRVKRSGWRFKREKSPTFARDRLELSLIHISASRLEYRSGFNSAQHTPPHESAHKHVTGEAIYTDDFAARKNMLEVWPVCAPHACARILKRDVSAAKQMPGIAAVLLAEDVPGSNDVGAVRRDEILLADKEVSYHGQIIALVVGETQEACRAAAEKIIVEYEPLPPILKIEDAIAQNSFHTGPNFIRRGDVQWVLKNSPQILEGEFYLAGQEHFYLEMQAACAEQGEDGSMFVMSSTQHPSCLLYTSLSGTSVSLMAVSQPCPPVQRKLRRH